MMLCGLIKEMLPELSWDRLTALALEWPDSCLYFFTLAFPNALTHAACSSLRLSAISCTSTTGSLCFGSPPCADETHEEKPVTK